MKLRWYQKEAVDSIRNAWAKGSKVVMLRLPTGGGKTPTFSQVINDEPGASVVIAHRSELVSQASLALAKYGVRHRVIGSSSLLRDCARIHINSDDVGYSHVDANARCAVASVDTLINKDSNAPWFKQVKLWVVDECFPAGTMVSGRPIESLEVGDMVETFDEASGRVELRPIVRLFRNPMPNHMMCISTVTHHVIKCTKGHPIFTKRGWINACDLTLHDEVLIYGMHLLFVSNNRDERSSTIQAEKDWSNILHENLRNEVQRFKSQTETEGTANSGVYNLREGYCYRWLQVDATPFNWQSLLFYDMLKRIPGKNIVGDNDSNQSEIRIGSNESQESDEKSRVVREDESYFKEDWAQTFGTRRQREASVSSGNKTNGTFSSARFHPASCNNYWNETWLRISASIQTGYGTFGSQNCNRSGRGYSFGKTVGDRPEERSLLNWVRLESIEVYEPRDINRTGKGYVYNIEVDEFHTYIANGVVVHNCHHLLRENKWGKAVSLFPNALGLGVTATPGRPDGKGLGRHNDGLADVLVHGPELRDLIEQGYLCDYKIYCPPSDIDISKVPITSSGEFSQDKLSEAIHRSRTIVGDVVDHYLKIAPGKLGITFAVDVEAARELAQAFRQRGIPSEVITGKTPPDLRASIMRRFRRREILQLTNVAVLGEGVDVPAVEVVSMACHTNSFIKYAQEFGRMLRLLLAPELVDKWDDFTVEQRKHYIATSDKPYGILLDHVGNVLRHNGPPDKIRTWSLDRRSKRSSGPSDAIPYRICANPECVQPYERIHKCCPHCGFYPEPASRSAPEYVDGDLLELDEATLMVLRGEIARVDGDPVIPWGAAPAVEGAVRKNHRLRQQSQYTLRNALAWWAGLQKSQGLTESQSLRKFYFKFGVDVAGAQTLGAREAEELTARINQELSANGIDGSVNAEAYLANRG